MEKNSTGEIIGNYRIINVLSRGSSGIVWRSQHIDTGEIHALKTVKVPYESHVQSIRRDILTLSRIKHPGVVKIHNYGLHDGLPWYSMDLVEGMPLNRFLTELIRKGNKKKIDSSGAALVRKPQNHGPNLSRNPQYPCRTLSKQTLLKVLSVFYKLCATLSFLHGEGIVHRDLKPENIVITSDDDPILIDFGFMKRMIDRFSRDKLEIDAEMFGTISYMAPELILNTTVDARTDLYALGCIIYEMIIGYPPFSAKNPSDILKAHLYQDPIPLINIEPSIPLELDELVKKLLAKKPNDRSGYADDISSVFLRLGVRNHLKNRWKTGRTYVYRSRLAGRNDQIKLLNQQLICFNNYQGGLHLISGESGVGKTRLIKEFCQSTKIRNIRILTGECSPHEKIPFNGIRGPLLTIADICREDGKEETDRILGSRGRILALYEPSLSGLPGQDCYPELPSISRNSLIPLTYQYLFETFQAMTEDGPILLLIDDLHWADEYTISFLHFLLRKNLLKQLRLFIIGTYRKEEINDNLQKLQKTPGINKIELTRLSKSEVATIISDMLAFRKVPMEFCHFLTEQSEGNPLFVNEYLRLALDQKLLTRSSDGSWQLVINNKKTDWLKKNLERLALPKSLHDLISHRINDLPQKLSQIVNSVAIIGYNIDVQLLISMTGFNEEELFTAIDKLVNRQIFERISNGKLRFFHSKIREVALQQMGDNDTHILHRKAAESIEHCYSSELDKHLAELADHWFYAGNINRARSYYLAAANKMKKYAPIHEVERLYTSYLKLVDQPCPDNISALHELTINVLLPSGRISEGISIMEKALADSREFGFGEEEAKSLRLLGELNKSIGKVDRAESFFDQALDISRNQGHRRVEGITLACLARLYQDQGRRHEAFQFFDQAILIHQETENLQAEGVTWGNLGVLYTFDGQLGPAKKALEKSIAILKKIADKHNEAIMLISLGNLFTTQIQHVKARVCFEQALAIVRIVGNPNAEAFILTNIAGLYYELGSYPKSLKTCQQALNIQRDTGNQYLGCTILGIKGLVYIQQNKLQKAMQLFRHILDTCQVIGNKEIEAQSLIYLGDVCWRQGHIQKARSSYRQALQTAQHLSDGNLECQTRLAIASFKRITSIKPETAACYFHQLETDIGQKGIISNLELLLECERAFQYLARGKSAKKIIIALEKRKTNIGYKAKSAMSRRIDRLRRAQQTYEANQTEKLYRGECIEDFPIPFRKWLVKSKRLSMSKANIPRLR